MAKEKEKEQPELWERQPDETPEAYEAFALYRDTEGERSISAVAAELRKSGSLMRRWSSRHNWAERVKAYDTHIEKEALKKAIQRRAEIRARQIKVGQALQRKGLDALERITISNPETALKMIIQGARLEDEQMAAEEQAHLPSADEAKDDDVLRHLDEILKEIKGAF